MKSMKTKILTTPEQQRQDCWALAAKIVAHEPMPFDLVIGIVRGGLPIAIYLHEFFMLHWRRDIGFAALRCKSYTGVGAADAVYLGDLSEVWRELGEGKNILLVDDIFDRGKTIFCALTALQKNAPPNVIIKTATLHYIPPHAEVPIKPDYYHQSFAHGEWIVYPAAVTDVKDEPEYLRAMGFASFIPKL